MATYYVQPNGSNANTGLGSSNAQAWQTVQKALGATGIGSGDTLYIAPGTYREAITIGGTYSATTTIIGDRTASQFTGITAGYVRITGLASDALGVATSLGNFTTNGKAYLTFDSLWLEHKITLAASSNNLTFIRCQMTTPFQVGVNLSNAVIEINTTGQSAILFDKCFIQGGVFINGTGTATTTRFNSCLIQCTTYSSGAFEFVNSGACAMTFSNCTIFGSSLGQVFRAYGPTLASASIFNCLIVPDVYTAATFGTNQTVVFTEDYNAGYITRVTTPSGANTKQLYHRAFTHTPIYINPIDASIIPYTPLTGESLIGAGSATYSFGTDFFGNAWANPPSIGAMELNTYSTIGAYTPTERNASTITIAPGSTSQSIELYLGATGLTASTSGLSAYYNRTRSADVQITLVARTIGQAWTSGGFAEVNPNTMPGVYRLDLPDAALAAGADDVTVVVRGASGTNGAVMTIKLSSGGLTAAQTAQAVLDAVGSSYVTAGTIGHAIQNNNVTSIVGSTAAASELSGALLHNGTDYIDSNLLGGASTRVFVGRFQMTQTGTTQGDIIEAFTTDTPAFELQLFDGDNNLVPVTGATLGLRILDVTSTVVETGTPTIEYGTGGIVRWTAPGTYLSIGCPAGMYRMFVDRTVSGTTTTFGPLQIKVQVQ